MTDSMQPETLDRRALFAAQQHQLTPRESQVLLCVASGQSNKEIAQELGIAVRTIEGHVANILRKCGCSSRTRLIARLW
jgi:DNA-binding NarL/FixJ family response regulator